jgi:7-carboxy-7-deazaguanine synthase
LVQRKLVISLQQSSECWGKIILNVSEIFLSIQGEGRHTGAVSAFIRLAGCDLRCRWCDTKYAWHQDQGQSLTIDQIVKQLCSYNCSDIVVTGGEPLLSPELDKLLDTLAPTGKYITLETSATQYRPIKCDLVSISPKLSDSTPTDNSTIARTHEHNRLNITAIQSFIDQHDYQLKFVLNSIDQLPEIEEILSQLTSIEKNKIMLMPQAETKKEYRQIAPAIAQICIDNNYRFCPRLHIELWDQQRQR